MDTDGSGLVHTQPLKSMLIKGAAARRQLYYLSSGITFVLAILYCVLVYAYSTYEGAQYGYYFLLGIPNYFFFYLTILPFVTAGMLYLATANLNIRFFGNLSPSLDEEKKGRVLRFRKILLAVALVFSVLVAIDDATDKGRALPPYALALSSSQDYVSALEKYKTVKEEGGKHVFEKNASLEKRLLVERHLQEQYFDHVKTLGFTGETITGFSSFSSWKNQSSLVYKAETFLSWLAALVISMLFAQIFLLLMVKDDVLPETKNLLLWLLILCSFWIPTKVFSVYYHSFVVYQPPGIVWFAIALLLVSAFLALFIKVEKNDMVKYAELTGALISVAATLVSIFKPEVFKDAFMILSNMGAVFGGILLFVVAFSIYLVTDHLIRSYERQKHDKDRTIKQTTDHTDSSTNHSGAT